MQPRGTFIVFVALIVAASALADVIPFPRWIGTDGDEPTWSAPLIIDATRAGGEPVIEISPSGTILVAGSPTWWAPHEAVGIRPRLREPAPGIASPLPAIVFSYAKSLREQ